MAKYRKDRAAPPIIEARAENVVVDLPAHGDAGGTGADVPPAAVEPMEMHAPADPVVVKAAASARLRVMSNYAFYTDEGAFKAWAEGVIVTDPEEIELLTGRKAPVERIEE